VSKPRVGVIGGTGSEGRGLAIRLAAAGYSVALGSRDAARARETAAALRGRLTAARPGGAAVDITGGDNRSAALAADVVILAVPWAAHDAALRELHPVLAGKILVDVVVPLVPPVTVAQPPPAGSAAARADEIVGDTCRVVAAFQNVAASKLLDLDADVACDVLVAGDDVAAKEVALEMCRAMGLIAHDAGPLANAAVVDGLTAVLVGLNKKHGVRTAGIRITNLPPLG
jgi:NADPH-dependent F420 reductase